MGCPRLGIAPPFTGLRMGAASDLRERPSFCLCASSLWALRTSMSDRETDRGTEIEQSV